MQPDDWNNWITKWIDAHDASAQEMASNAIALRELVESRPAGELRSIYGERADEVAKIIARHRGWLAEYDGAMEALQLAIAAGADV